MSELEAYFDECGDDGCVLSSSSPYLNSVKQVSALEFPAESSAALHLLIIKTLNNNHALLPSVLDNLTMKATLSLPPPL